MDIPIDLHNQRRLVTVKVNDKSLNDLLPSEMDAQLVRPPKVPEGGNSSYKIFSAGVISRRLSLFSLFENGEMSEGQRGGALEFCFGNSLFSDDVFERHLLILR